MSEPLLRLKIASTLHPKNGNLVDVIQMLDEDRNVVVEFEKPTEVGLRDIEKYVKGVMEWLLNEPR